MNGSSCPVRHTDIEGSHVLAVVFVEFMVGRGFRGNVVRVGWSDLTSSSAGEDNRNGEGEASAPTVNSC